MHSVLQWKNLYFPLFASSITTVWVGLVFRILLVPFHFVVNSSITLSLALRKVTWMCMMLECKPWFFWKLKCRLRFGIFPEIPISRWLVKLCLTSASVVGSRNFQIYREKCAPKIKSRLKSKRNASFISNKFHTRTSSRERVKEKSRDAEQNPSETV